MIDTLIKAIMEADLQAKAAPEATDDVFKRAPFGGYAVRRSVLRMDFDACAPLHQSDIELFRRDIAFIQGHDDCIKRTVNRFFLR